MEKGGWGFGVEGSMVGAGLPRLVNNGLSPDAMAFWILKWVIART